MTMRLVAMLLTGMLLVGCGRGQQRPAAVQLAPDARIENVVGDLLTTQPRIAESIGEWKSTQATPTNKSDMATVTPFFGGRVERKEGWRYRIEGKKGVVVVDAQLSRLNQDPWRWTITDPVPEKDFLARYEVRPRSPGAVRLDEMAAALILADPLVKAACGEVKELVVLDGLALKANDPSIDYFSLKSSGRPKSFHASSVRHYEAKGPDGEIQLVVRFDSRGESGEWKPSENAVQPVIKGTSLWAFSAYPPPHRIPLLPAP